MKDPDSIVITYDSPGQDWTHPWLQERRPIHPTTARVLPSGWDSSRMPW